MLDAETIEKGGVSNPNTEDNDMNLLIGAIVLIGVAISTLMAPAPTPSPEPVPAMQYKWVLVPNLGPDPPMPGVMTEGDQNE